MTALRSAAVPRRPVVVAIPAKDEADRIGSCLMAINRQDRRPDTVVILLNNCTDGTAAVIQALRPHLAFPLKVVSRSLPPVYASAGYARRIVMTIAARLAGPKGVLLSTDADTVPSSDWVLRNLAAIDRGADLVCGVTMMNPEDEQVIPLHVRRDEVLERELISLQDGFACMLDPEPHDPAPRHTEAPGASLALTVAALRRVGGVPALRSGEDRALARALWMLDARVRHDPSVSVTVSGRIVGRAAGGMADTLRRRVTRQDELADERAEPSRRAWQRYLFRHRARRFWAGGDDPTLATELAVSKGRFQSALRQPHFGAAWTALEASTPILVRQRVRLAELPDEIAVARTLLPADVLAAD